MLDAGRAVLQAILDARVQNIGKFGDDFLPERFLHRIAAERQRQAARLGEEPLAEIGAEEKALTGVGQLAFVDDEAHFRLAAREGVEDLIERHDDVVELLLRQAEIKLQREKGAGHQARYGDFFRAEFLAGKWRLADEHRPVVVAHAGAAAEQGVVLEHVGAGVDRDGGDVELGPRGALVERLDVLEDVLEFVARRREQVLRQRVKHEGVVRIGRVAKR